MKRSVLLLVLAAALGSCTGVPPVSVSFVTPQGAVTVPPDGRIEVVIEPLPEK